MTMAISGALLAGLGAPTPVIGDVVAPSDPAAPVRSPRSSRCDRPADRRGYALILIGLALALAPGKDGGDLGGPLAPAQGVDRGQAHPTGWRFAGGIGLVLVAWSVLRVRPHGAHRGIVAAVLTLYVGVVVCLRAADVVAPRADVRGLRRGWIVAVAAAMAIALVGAASGAVALAAATKTTPANALQQGCNGYFDLCAQPMSQIVWPASHNAMSSSAYNFLGAEHTITIPEQLNAGARFLMLDVYYGYDDNGIVRTNLAGGIDRKELEKTRGKEEVDALQRVGALTGTADTSGKKQELYFCHDLCELGAVKAVDVFREIDRFLDVNLTDVLVLDFEDYVQPKDIKAALVESGLWDRVRTTSPKEITTRALGEIVTPEGQADGGPAPGHHGEREARRRLQVAARRPTRCSRRRRTRSRRSRTSAASRSGAGPARRCSSSTTGCDPNGPPDPVEAGPGELAQGAPGPLPHLRRGPQATAQRARGRLHRHRRPLQDRQRAQRRDRDGERRRARHRQGDPEGAPQRRPLRGPGARAPGVSPTAARVARAGAQDPRTGRAVRAAALGRCSIRVRERDREGSEPVPGAGAEADEEVEAVDIELDVHLHDDHPAPVATTTTVPAG